MACGKITKGILVDKCKPQSGGVKDRMWVGNLEDIADVTELVNNPMVVSNIIMKSGTFIYPFEGQKRSIQPEANQVPRTYTNANYEHLVRFLTFSNDADILQQLSNLDLGSFFVIVENSNRTFEVFGLEQGLQKEEGARAYQNGDTGLGTNVLLRTPSGDFPGEPYPPKLLFDTDYATTLENIESMMQPVTP